MITRSRPFFLDALPYHVLARLRADEGVIGRDDDVGECAEIVADLLHVDRVLDIVPAMADKYACLHLTRTHSLYSRQRDAASPAGGHRIGHVLRPGGHAANEYAFHVRLRRGHGVDLDEPVCRPARRNAMPQSSAVSSRGLTPVARTTTSTSISASSPLSMSSTLTRRPFSALRHLAGHAPYVEDARLLRALVKFLVVLPVGAHVDIGDVNLRALYPVHHDARVLRRIHAADPGAKARARSACPWSRRTG